MQYNAFEPIFILHPAEVKINMGISFSFGWEVTLLAWLQQFSSPLTIAAAQFFSLFGEELLLIGILGFVYWCWDKELGRYVGLHAAAAVGFGSMLKNCFLRRRPYFDHPAVQCLRAPNGSGDPMDIAAQGFSFPSLHALNITALFGSVTTYLKKGYWAAAALSLLVGLSRMILGVHYPTDVLTGWVLGFVIALVIPLVMQKYPSALVTSLLLTAIALPGWFFCTTDEFFSAFGLIAAMPVSFLFESRYVNFQNTRKPLSMLLRLLCGVALFALLSQGLKLCLPAFLLTGTTFAAHLARSFRYFVSCFVIFSVYPLVFRYKLFR